MATVNQIRKSIEVSEKALIKYNKNAAMYDSRATKKIEQARKATGKEFDRANYAAVLSSDSEWSIRYDINLALDYYYENCKKVERETRRLENLRAELDKMMADAARTEKENAPLEAALRDAMSEFRVVWFARMEEYFEKHFDHIREILPAVRARYNKVRRISDKYGWRLYSDHRRIYNRIEEIRKGCAEVISDDAASMERSAYLVKMHEETVKVWDAGIKKLTAKCKTFGVDENKVVARHPNVTGKGFTVILTDGKDREIDARVIWAAEYSEFVCPHTRYIVTERHN